MAQGIESGPWVRSETMSSNVALRDRERPQPEPAQVDPEQPDPANTAAQASPWGADAAVLPAPLHTLGAVAVGGLAGVGAVYLVASRLAGTLAAVAAVVMIFAVTMAGPWVHARSGTELGRVFAVALQAVAFGGLLGGLVILT